MVVLSLRNLLDRPDGGAALAEANALKVVAQLQQVRALNCRVVDELTRLLRDNRRFPFPGV
jgi:hypothetical protein